MRRKFVNVVSMCSLVMQKQVRSHNTPESSLISTSMSKSVIPTTHHEHHHHHEHGGIELHTLIGVSLSIGFIFMLLIDQISGGHSHGASGNFA